MKFFANDICNVYIISKRFAPLAVKCYDELAIFKLKGVQVIAIGIMTMITYGYSQQSKTSFSYQGIFPLSHYRLYQYL